MTPITIEGPAVPSRGHGQTPLRFRGVSAVVSPTRAVSQRGLQRRFFNPSTRASRRQKAFTSLREIVVDRRSRCRKAQARLIYEFPVFSFRLGAVPAENRLHRVVSVISLLTSRPRKQRQPIESPVYCASRDSPERKSASCFILVCLSLL
jgi:hypothetical protein